MCTGTAKKQKLNSTMGVLNRILTKMDWTMHLRIGEYHYTYQLTCRNRVILYYTCRSWCFQGM